MYLRECQLYNIVEDLLAEHDEEELDRQLEPTARGITLRIASHCINNPIYVFPEKELRGLRPNSYIHVSVIGPQFGCSKIDRPILEICKSLTDI
jgi:hypothetical protein